MTKLQEIILSIVIICLLVLLGGVIGYKLAANKYSVKLVDAQKRELALQQDITAQNQAVLRLKQEADARTAQAQAAILAAQAQAHIADQAAQKILTARPPPGVDLCKAARDAFDDELKQERGSK